MTVNKLENTITMNRINKVFSTLKQNNQKALIPYITAGDPNLNVTLETMHAMADKGADIIELGVPFTDPMADGPVIQAACERSLKSGTTLTNIIETVSKFRKKNTITPIVLMGYLNPVLTMGFETFLDKAKTAGIDGILLVDMPVEEAEPYLNLLTQFDILPIFLVAPTTTKNRLEKIAHFGKGYLYYVSVKGITGTKSVDVSDVEKHLIPIRKITELPIAVGFGIKDPESAAQVAKIADGVVVGSILVNDMAKLNNMPDLIAKTIADKVASLKAGF